MANKNTKISIVRVFICSATRQIPASLYDLSLMIATVRRVILPSRFLSTGEAMLKSELLAALKAEIHRHDFSHFVDEPPSIAQGGRGVVVPGCPMCRKRFGTTPQFLDHQRICR